MNYMVSVVEWDERRTMAELYREAESGSSCSRRRDRGIAPVKNHDCQTNRWDSKYGDLGAGMGYYRRLDLARLRVYLWWVL
jgi:hypothetical protein